MKMKNIMLKEMRLAIIGLFLLGSVPLMMAGENPSAKPIRQKTSWIDALFGGSSVQSVRSTVQFTPTKSVSMPSSASGSAPSISVPTVSGSSNLFRHTAVPSAVAAPRSASFSQPSAGVTSAFGSLSTERLKRNSNVAGSGFSGGASAGGLMSSGSQYSSSAANGGGATLSISSGPRRVNDPKDPLIDEEEEEDVPIGDTALPLALLACVYLILRVARKRSRALKR